MYKAWNAPRTQKELGWVSCVVSARDSPNRQPNPHPPFAAFDAHRSAPVE